MLPTLTLEPIGVVRSPFVEAADAPRQACVADVAGRIELVAGRHLEDAVADLASWSHLWVVFWFHRNAAYRPKVLPPRSLAKRGVLATRSPHRPNPIGLSAVRLERVDGLVLHVRDLDMLDGTPVLDLKPYVPYADVVAGAASGWLDAVPRDPAPGFEVAWSASAEAELAFVEAAGVRLREPVTARLALGPQPHAYRRITLSGDTGRLAYKDWRISFRVAERRIEVTGLATGYRPRELATSPDPAVDLHRRFAARFGR